jgi:hypothetical protein
VFGLGVQSRRDQDDDVESCISYGQADRRLRSGG